MASRETDAIVAKHRSSGIGGRVTSIASPAPDRANKSFHAAEGTGGMSTAVDLADDSGNVPTATKQAIFDLFLPDKAEIAELFYAFAPVYVKNGRAYPISRMNRSVWLNHRDHVHIAVRKGTFLKASSPAPVTQPQEDEDDMPKLPTDIVDALPFPDLTGAWLLQRDGGVITKGHPDRFYGSPHATPQADRPKPWPEFISIKPWGNGGYVVTAVTGWFGNYDAAIRDDLKRRGLLK